VNKEITTTKIAIFRKREIRKAVHNNEWWLVIVDVAAAFTDSVQPDGYIKNMRRRDNELSEGWGQIATPFLSRHQGEIKSLIAPILKVFSALFSPSHPRFCRGSDGYFVSIV